MGVVVDGARDRGDSARVGGSVSKNFLMGRFKVSDRPRSCAGERLLASAQGLDWLTGKAWKIRRFKEDFLRGGMSF